MQETAKAQKALDRVGPTKATIKAHQAYAHCKPCWARDDIPWHIRRLVKALRSPACSEVALSEATNDDAIETVDDINRVSGIISRALRRAGDTKYYHRFNELMSKCNLVFHTHYVNRQSAHEVHVIINREISQIFPCQVTGVVDIIQSYLCTGGGPSAFHHGCQQTTGGVIARAMAVAYRDEYASVLETMATDLDLLEHTWAPRAFEDATRLAIASFCIPLTHYGFTPVSRWIPTAIADLNGHATTSIMALNAPNTLCKHYSDKTRILVETFQQRIEANVAEHRRLQNLGFNVHLK